MKQGGENMGKTSWEVKAKYNEKVYDKLTINIPKGEKQEWKERAEKEGKSLTQWVRDRLNQD